jgi:GAF domain-containing protein/two-component sensor histidine kinase
MADLNDALELGPPLLPAEGLLAQMQVANDIVQELVALASVPPEDSWHGQPDRSLEIAEVLATRLVTRLGAASVQVWLHDKQDGSYFSVAQAGVPDPSGVTRLYPDDTPLGQVVKKGAPILSNNLLAEPWLLTPEWVVQEQIQSLATYTISMGSDILGALTVFCRHILAPEFLEVLKLISSYTATAWVNARQTAQLFHQAQRDGLIRQISQKLRRSLDLPTMQQTLVECVGTFLGVDGCDLLWIPQLKSNSDVFGAGPAQHADCANTASWTVERLATHVQTSEPAWDPIAHCQALLQDPACLEVLKRQQVIKGEVDGAALLLVPLILRQPYAEEVMGFLTVYQRHAQRFSEPVVDLLQAIATQAALALHNAHLYEQTRQQGEREALLNRITTTLHQSLDWDQIVETTIDLLHSTLDLSRCCLLRLESHHLSVAYESRVASLKPMDPAYDISEFRDYLAGLGQGQIVYFGPTTPDPCGVLEGLQIQSGVLIPVQSEQPTLSTTSEPGSDALIGLVGAFKTDDYIWQPAEVKLLQSAAHQLAVALTRARLFDHVRRQHDRMTLLNSITTVIRSSLDPATLFQAITQQIGAAFEADVCTLALWHSDFHYLRPVGIYAPQLTAQELEAILPGLTLLTLSPQQQPTIDWGSQLISPQPLEALPAELGNRLRMGARLLLEQRTPLVVGDSWDPSAGGCPLAELEILALAEQTSTTEQGCADPRLPLGDPRGMLLVPLLQGDQLVGGISLKRIGQDRPQWQPDDLDLASAVADQAAIAIVQARLLTQTQHQARRENQLRQVAQSFSLAYDPTRIIDIALRGMAQALNVGECVFISRGSDLAENLPSSELRIQQGYRQDGHPSPRVGQPLSDALSQLIQHQCYERHDCLRIGTMQSAPLPPGLASPDLDADSQGILCAPLMPGEQEVTGVLCGIEPQPRDFSDADVDLLQALVDMTAMALQRAQFYERSRRQEATAAAVRGLAEGREAESRRLAADLHDQTLADLGAMARHLRTLALNPELGSAALATVALIDDQLRDTITELRGIVEDLQPTAMGAFNLGSALRSLMERAAQRSPQPLVTRFDDRSEGLLSCLDPLTQSTLFRILQEALNNVVKHAQAHRLDVIIGATHLPTNRRSPLVEALHPEEDPTLIDGDLPSSATAPGEDPSMLVLRIIDDGIGISGESNRHRGHGLSNMRYRSELIGGHIEWRGRRLGSGTVVELRIPLHPNSSPQSPQ